MLKILSLPHVTLARFQVFNSCPWFVAIILESTSLWGRKVELLGHSVYVYAMCVLPLEYTAKQFSKVIELIYTLARNE